MSKFIVFLLLIVTVFAADFFLMKPIAPVNNIPTLLNSTSTVIAVTNTAPSGTLGRVDPYAGGVDFIGYKMPPVVNASTGVVISFKNFQGAGGSGNVSADMYVNQRNVGKTGGLLLLDSNFSPDNRYFAMLFDSDSGASNFSNGIDYIDLKSPTSTIWGNPKIPQGYAGDSNKFSISQRIESFSWNSDDSMNITSYLVGSVYDEQNKTLIYYRITPKQIWHYNLKNRSYALIQTLPEVPSGTSQ